MLSDVQELNKVYSAHKTIAVTPDLKRAVAVVHNLLRAVRETEVVGKATRTATRPKAINRYCHANMCLDKDAQHERDCPKPSSKEARDGSSQTAR